MALLSGFDQLNTTSDTFSDWLNKTNELILMTRGDTTGAQTSIMTANGLPGGSLTYGNATLFGQFAANGVVVFNEGQSPSSNAYANGYYGGLRGGTWDVGTNNFTTDTLYITSNTTYTAEGVEVYVESTYGLIVENNIEARDDVLFVGTGGSNTDPKLQWVDSTNILNFNDSVKATFGTAGNQELFYASGRMYSNTDNYDIRARTDMNVVTDTFELKSETGSELYISANVADNSTVRLYYENVERMQTNTYGIVVTGQTISSAGFVTYNNQKIEMGGANYAATHNFEIWTDGSNSNIIETGAGSLNIKGTNLYLQATDGTTYFSGIDGANTLIHWGGDGSTKITVHTAGVNIEGEANTDTLRVQGSAEFESSGTDKVLWVPASNIWRNVDGVKATFGTSDDLQIYHDGSHSFISDAAGTGNLYVLSNIFSIRNAANSEVLFTATENGAIQLYYDNTQRLATTSIGVEIEGEANTDTLRAQSTVYLESDVYFGTKASPSTADITWNTTTNVLNFNDSITATFGDSDDLSIKHDGTNSIIENSTGTLILQSNNITLRTDQGTTETMLTAAVDGAVTLYYDNSVKFATTTTGATLTGTLIADGITVGDNEIIQLGTTMQLYNTGTISYIVETGTGNLILQGNNTLLQSTAGESYLQAVADGAVTLYFNNSAKLATITGGVDVTGNLVSDGIVSDGNALLNRDVDLGSGTSNTISFIGRVDTAITPNANNTLDIGTNLLRWNDGYFGGLLTTDLLTCESNASFQESISVIGGVTAATFSGSGASLTNLNASNISSGTIGDAYLPATISSDITGTATQANTIYITTNTTDNNFRVPYASDVVGNYETLYGKSDFYFNPFSETLSVPNLTVTDSVSLPASITFSNTTTFENIYVSNTAFIYSLEITSLEANGVALTGTGGDVTVASTDTVIDSFDKGQTQGFKYLVHGENLGNADSGYIVEINVIVTDNGAIYYTRYGEVDNSIGTVTITPVVNTVPTIDQIQLVANCSAAGPGNTHRFKVMKIETRP